ncbi:hypothetical protein FSP39_014027 [Pinctada imbricata]|uniref:Autophagy-related protein 13 n=1 Tax=Pinctada imbricata TaxID=66713 RepID=A0AA89C5E7_PINIB|nr:hypothetical protein FSP39_014027 [Pinctada imbricata]
MSNTKLSQQDRKDLEKFTKFLIYKSLQIIVQARLGDKIKTKSKPYTSGADWFNIAIKDIPDVHAATKKALLGQTSLLSQNVCAEISLKTSEGSSMVLETWYIGLNKEQCDPHVRVSFAVYNRMGIVLKSLFSVSRVTPAYRLSRRQGACSDDYVICYRFYHGEPQFFMLGDNYQTIKVGAVPTPCGTININLAYRTKLQITPQRTSRETKFEVKDDHFRKDSPKRPTTPKPCSMGYRRNSTSEDLEQDGVDGQDLCSTTFTNSPGDVFSHGVMQSGPAQHSQPIKISPRAGDRYMERAGDRLTDQHLDKPESVEKHPSFTSLQKVGAFAQPRVSKDIKNDFDDVPFLSLLQQNGNTEDITDKNVDSKNTANDSNKSLGQKSVSSGENMEVTSSTDSISSNASAPEDFVMVELKTPFAGADPNTDLNKFYRECQGAPSLNMFEEHP